jgi:membrane-bound lytic murein transglycosylase D
MDSSKNKAEILAMLVFMLLFPFSIFCNTTTPETEEEAIIRRLESMENPVVKPRYDPVVKSYLNTYTQRRREVSEAILGLQSVYFPLFEEALKQKELPHQLKILAVVESALQTKAISHAGAVGLWQFMAPTARELGLQIDQFVDERRDPHRASDAAATYLRQLYKHFNDWELAVAAYNSGSGRVSRAVKRGRSTNYWAIRQYLPRETANYVPAYIAACYLMEHFDKHDLHPKAPEADQLQTTSLLVFQDLSFEKIVQLTDLPLATVEFLNPAFSKATIPAANKGYYLTLPTRVIEKVKAYLETLRPDFENRLEVMAAPVAAPKFKETFTSDLVHSTYVVKAGENIESLAQLFNCTTRQIKNWNNLNTLDLAIGQEIVVYHHRGDLNFSKSNPLISAVACLPVLMRNSVQSKSGFAESTKKNQIKNDAYLTYIVDKPQTIFEIAIKIPGVSVEDILKLNDKLTASRTLKAGTKLRIKKF